MLFLCELLENIFLYVLFRYRCLIFYSYHRPHFSWFVIICQVFTFLRTTNAFPLMILYSHIHVKTWNKSFIIHILSVCAIHWKFTFSLFIIYWNCQDPVSLNFWSTIQMWPILFKTIILNSLLGTQLKGQMLPFQWALPFVFYFPHLTNSLAH